MTAIETMADVLANQIGISVSLVEADLFTANIVTDSLKEDTQFPVFILIPVMETENERVNASMVNRKIPVFGFMLTTQPKLDQSGTTDFNFPAVRSTVENMKFLVDKFTNKLYKAAITDKSTGKGITKYKCTEVYSKLDAHLFGCQVSFSWDVTENVIC